MFVDSINIGRTAFRLDAHSTGRFPRGVAAIATGVIVGVLPARASQRT